MPLPGKLSYSDFMFYLPLEFCYRTIMDILCMRVVFSPKDKRNGQKLLALDSLFQFFVPLVCCSAHQAVSGLHLHPLPHTRAGLLEVERTPSCHALLVVLQPRLCHAHMRRIR